MSHVNFHPHTTLHQFVQTIIADAQAEFNWNIRPFNTSVIATDEIWSYLLWEASATNANINFANEAHLELIAGNTEGLLGKLDEVSIDLQARMTALDTSLVLTWREVLEPELVRDLALALNVSTAPDTTLKDFIHPDLASLNDNVTIGLGRIKEELRFATVTEDLRAFDSITLLLQRLDELVAATQAQGGQSLDEWLEEVTPRSIPPLGNKVFSIEGITPFMKVGASTITFIIEKLALLLGPILKGALAGADAAAPLFKPLIDPVLDGIENRLSRLTSVAPHQALPLAREFLSDAFTNGLRARITAILVEKGGDQMKNLGVQQISGLIAELAGFSQLAEAVWGTALKTGIGRPAEYQMNALTLSKIPSEGQLIESAIERKVSVDALRELLKFHGYADGFVDMLINTMWTDPRLREIILLASDSSVAEDDIRHWLSEAGYDDTDIARMTPVVVQQSNRQHRQALTSEVMANLGEGFLDEEDAEAQFDRLRYTEEAKRLLLDTGRLKFRREVIQAHIGELEQMFQLEQMKEPEFRLALEGLGVRKEKIEAIVGKAFSKFIGRVSKEEEAQVDKQVREFQAASLAALKAQFASGLIQSEAFFANLVAVGFLPQIAREIVALEQIKLFSKVAGEKLDEAERLRDEIRRARIAAFVELFQDGFINEAALREDLLALGLARELANALVFREVAKKAELPKPVKSATAR